MKKTPAIPYRKKHPIISVCTNTEFVSFIQEKRVAYNKYLIANDQEPVTLSRFMTFLVKKGLKNEDTKWKV